MKISTQKSKGLLQEIRQLVEKARHNVIRNINTELLLTYWNVGRLIVHKEQSEQYDDTSVRNMLLDISKQLTRELGRGFSRSQLTYMRLFYLRFPVNEFNKGIGVTPVTPKRKSCQKTWFDSVRPIKLVALL